MYRVLLKKEARKALEKIDNRYKERILRSLLALASDPHAGKPLVGKLQGLYSLRMWPYRIIYAVYKKELVVLVIDIGHRQGVYQ